ncbi:Stf0 family sulfotransferase [Pseudoroseicyclus tamaricis]|uniref:Sulfotransferase n=1 Tax=Pseudoroseicyclus tamaricis TaxID=2705421 RepID=A0A6B2K122_9RHOB|nr:Stf0 family sulfotransferase [Pseudoroseicyclus tamaricis]NDV02134.1 sulfotransferase [Pseudoroseicyclus tamaricis]
MTKGYIIFTTPRSGSTLLCRLLAATGVAGSPNSHFHEPSLEGWLEDYDLSLEDYPGELDASRAVVAAALTRGRGETEVFGMRVQRESFPFFLAQMHALAPEAEGDMGAMEAVLGRLVPIYLRRGGKLDQAISYIRAEQTGLWHKAPDGSEVERLSPPRPPVYDGAAIAERVRTALAEEAAWEAWFTKAGVSPLSLTYEALAADPEGEVALILAALGQPVAAASGLEPGVARIADALNKGWAARFRAEEPELAAAGSA